MSPKLKTTNRRSIGGVAFRGFALCIKELSKDLRKQKKY
jgi:hypothetical protein